MVRTVTTIDIKGPFFTRNVALTIQENIRVMMAAMAAEGEADVGAQLSAGESGRAPIYLLRNRVSEHVVGRVKALGGKRWTYHAVISVNNHGLSAKEGIALMAAASETEGKTHAFRRTGTRLRNARAVNLAELTKGLE